MHLIHGDCLIELKKLPDNSIESLVTDPPAGISFMGKSWDSDKGGRDQWIKWLTEVMRECHRVLKPGAMGLVWALPRTSHWTATALENAGFEIRDVVTHLFGSGFPKSLNISKAIDRAAGAEREVIGTRVTKDIRRNVAEDIATGKTDRQGKFAPGSPNKLMEYQVTSSATDAAKQWDGWGTALKPASEHWILIRKPLSEKTVAANVLKWGVGGINIDGCRITLSDFGEDPRLGGKGQWNIKRESSGHTVTLPPTTMGSHSQGRFPANLVLSHHADCEPSPYVYPDGSTESQCHDECPVRMLDGQSGVTKSPNKTVTGGKSTFQATGRNQAEIPCYGDTGGASRFFYCAKVSTSERGKDNKHPTVKAKKLMGYLIKLITPPEGTVLDPFMGSGSTGIAAKEHDFNFIGIEQEKEYLEIAKNRINTAALVCFQREF